MQRQLWTWLGSALLAAGCGDKEEGLAPTDDGPPTSDDVCPEDPDARLGGELPTDCPDYWVCTEGEGGKVCDAEAGFPDDENEWTCVVEGGQNVCHGDDLSDGGAGEGWTCVESIELGVVCTTDLPALPDDGAGLEWNCEVTELVTCEGTETGTDGPEPGTDEPGPGEPVPDDGETICYFGDDGAADDPALAEAQYAFGQLAGQDAIFVRLIFAESFVDNTYGANSSDGYHHRGHPHRFEQLLESDHALVSFTDGAGATVLQARLDYLSASADAPSGYRSLGVSGEEGVMEVGDASAFLSVTTSLAENLNTLGCVYTVDSPAPDDPACPGWERRVIYDMWLSPDAFGAAGFGAPQLFSVHASPSRMDNTETVHVGDCP